ncbi:hypothetical protein GCM10027411_23050 [Microbacterium aureliae]
MGGMAHRSPQPRRSVRWSVLPRLVEGAHPRVVLLVGLALAVLGALMALRPLTSLFLLALYVGVSAIVAGVWELASPRGAVWWRRVFAAAWVLVGLAVIVWFGRSLDLAPTALAVLLVVGGLASLGDATAGGLVSQRLLGVAWGAAQLVFGVLALTWPDVTVLLVAAVFGVRTLLFGLTLMIRGGQELYARRGPGRRRGASGAARRWLAAGRIALAALLIATASGAWWVNQWLAEGAPVIDAFYDPPAELPREHGMLIREDDFEGRQPVGATVRRILYTTIDARSAPAVGSALVIIPDGVSWQPRDVILWNHGTTGVARGCAPSLREASATKWAIPALDEAIARGWVVVAPDYSGQGAPGVFPYLIGEGEAQSALDAVLAADEAFGVWLTDRVAVWGHSQGGHAALWTAQLAREYTPDLTVVGTAALAPVADPLAVARELAAPDPSPLLTVLISWVLVPYADTYPDVVLEDYVAAGARSIVREMTARCPSEPGVVVSVLAALGVSEDRPLYVGDLTGGALGARLAQNAATGPFEQPLLVAWGTADEVIPPALQQGFVDRACADGAQVRWAIYGGTDHLGILLPSSRFLPLLIGWTEDRLDGGAGPVDDCERLGAGE